MMQHTDTHTESLDQLASDFDSLFVNSTVEEAVIQIKTERLDRMRCVLTGAPYATIDESEIRLYLNSRLDAKTQFSTPLEHLLDMWDLNLLSLCSRISPALTNKGNALLAELISLDTQSAHARLITYYLTRFFHSPSTASRAFKSAKLIDRMHFSIDWFDYLVTLPLADLRRVTFRFAACDAWLPLNLWSQLSFFNTRNEIDGFMNPDISFFRHSIVSPSNMPVAIESVSEIIKGFDHLMAYTQVNGGVAHIAPPSAESLSVTRILSELFNVGIGGERLEVDAQGVVSVRPRKHYSTNAL